MARSVGAAVSNRQITNFTFQARDCNSFDGELGAPKADAVRVQREANAEDHGEKRLTATFSHNAGVVTELHLTGKYGGEGLLIDNRREGAESGGLVYLRGDDRLPKKLLIRRNGLIGLG